MPKPTRGNILAERLLIVACLAFGAVARFTPATPLWLDEALSVNIAKAPLGDIGDLLRRDGHPPLYYWLLHGWIQLFGDGDAAVRALSGVLGLVAIVLVFLVGRRLGGPALGALAAAVVAVSPYAVRYSSEARMYELVVVLVLAGWLLLDASRRTARLPVLLGLAATSAALVLTHYWSLFLLAAVVGALALAVWRHRRTPTAAAAMRSAIALAAGCGALVPWLSAMRYQSAHTGTPWASAPRPTRVASESIVDFAGGNFPESTLLLAMLVVLAVVAVLGRRHEGGVLLGRIATDWRAEAAAIALATAAMGAAVAFASGSAFAGRYASVYFPMAMLLVAAGMVLVPRGWARVGVLASLAALSAAVVLVQVLRYDRTQAGLVATAIDAEAQPGDVVVVCPDQLGPGLARLVDTPGVRVVRYPDLGDPHFVDWVDYAERHAAVDPVTVAEQVLVDAGPGAIWLNWSDGYRTVGPLCGRFAAHLIASRPGGTLLVSGDNVRYFEWSSLIRLPPPLA